MIRIRNVFVQKRHHGQTFVDVTNTDPLSIGIRSLVRLSIIGILIAQTPLPFIKFVSSSWWNVRCSPTIWDGAPCTRYAGALFSCSLCGQQSGEAVKVEACWQIAIDACGGFACFVSGEFLSCQSSNCLYRRESIFVLHEIAPSTLMSRNNRGTYSQDMNITSLWSVDITWVTPHSLHCALRSLILSGSGGIYFVWFLRSFHSFSACSLENMWRVASELFETRQSQKDAQGKRLISGTHLYKRLVFWIFNSSTSLLRKIPAVVCVAESIQPKNHNPDIWCLEGWSPQTHLEQRRFSSAAQKQITNQNDSN